MSRDNRRISGWLKMLERKIDRDGDALLRGSGITVTQLRVLKYLQNHPDEPQIADISEFFGVSHASMVHVVNVLEEKGIVRREPIRRSRGKRIVLTETGRSLAEQNEGRINQLESAMTEDFSDEELSVLVGMLQRIDKNLDNAFGN